MVEELKFKSIEIKSFRGIKDLTLDLQNKSLVICGPNGTGKSSIIQAFEYLFTEKISALSTVRGKTHVIHKGDKKEDLHSPILLVVQHELILEIFHYL